MKSIINRSHSTKYQNIVTLENEREALGFWSNLDQLQWLGFGLPAGLMAFNRDQTLGLRSVIPLLSALYCGAKVRSSVSLQLT